MEENIKNKQPEEQAGFQAKRSIVALEKWAQGIKETDLALIDLEKEYDSNRIRRLWKKIKNLENRSDLYQ